MTEDAATWTALAGLALTGLALAGLALAGAFFVFSICVMRALDRIRGETAIAAMQSINRVTVNPFFFAAFFLTPLAALAAAWLAWSAGAGQASAVFGGAGLVYLAGTSAPTMLFNVPMTDRLDTPGPAPVSDADKPWRAFSGPWTTWNHGRAAASGATPGLIGAGPYLLGAGV